MRTFILSAVIAVTAAASLAAPAQAGGFSYGYVTVGGYDDYHHGRRGHHGYGHHKQHYSYDYGYDAPRCYVKRVKKWDQWGNLRVKKVKICD